MTTGAWVRGILADDYGVDLDRVTWVTVEEAHVAEFRDPPNVERAPAGKDLATMLRDGTIDAAILGEVPARRLAARAADPGSRRRRAGLAAPARRDPDQSHGGRHRGALARAAGRGARGLPAARRRGSASPACRRPGELDTTPFGLDANRRNLEVAIDCVHRQRLIPRRFTVDELFDDVTRTLPAV